MRILRGFFGTFLGLANSVGSYAKVCLYVGIYKKTWLSDRRCVRGVYAHGSNEDGARVT
jgi:hypothetical protein